MTIKLTKDRSIYGTARYYLYSDGALVDSFGEYNEALAAYDKLKEAYKQPLKPETIQEEEI